MRQFILTMILCAFILPLNAQNTSQNGDSIKLWTPEWQQQFLSDRENPEKWDAEHYKEDLENFPKENREPMAPRVFPVPNYDLYPGTFNGMGGGVVDFVLSNGQRVVCVVNCNFKTSLNETLTGDRDQDIFLLLAVATDVPRDTVTYDDTNMQVISRNHPDAVSRGYIRTSDTDKVEYIAFRTATNDAYALVNMRLFNLNDGNLVIIVPQEDGSLRSMQIKPEEPLEFETLRKYLTSLFNDNERVNKFLTTRRDEFSIQNSLDKR